MRNRLRRNCIFLVLGLTLLVFVLVLGATVSIGTPFRCQTAHAQLETLPPNLLPMNLTVIDLNGTEVFLNSTDIASLSSVTGLGGYATVDNYTGVPLTTFCDIVGGINNDTVVKITGADNYSQTFTYEQIADGNFTTAPHSQPLTLIIAYYKNNVNLTNQGPLMTAIIGPEGVLTAGKIWIWYTVKIQILNASVVPELQILPLVFFLMMTVSTMIILLRKYPRTRDLCSSG